MTPVSFRFVLFCFVLFVCGVSWGAGFSYVCLDMFVLLGLMRDDECFFFCVFLRLGLGLFGWLVGW